MKIQESSLQLTSSREASRHQSLEVETAQEFRQVMRDLGEHRDARAEALAARVQRLLQSLIEAILAALDGKKCSNELGTCETPIAGDAAAPTGRSIEIGWQRKVVETVRESETTRVCGKGEVSTADGRCIRFDLAVDMARSHVSRSEKEESGVVRLQDPLVLSYPGQSCELLAQCISFDLDADGRAEQIPKLGEGSGFLVFDRNANGRADDGKELFGVASGDGFADLAKLDGDGNGWIDEADAAWSRLGLWSGERFESLTAAGSGALNTAAVNSEFSLKSADNALLGQIRAAGVYLTEAGAAGLVQHVDLAVSAPPPGNQQPAERQHLPT